jgi:hypothetical protein
LHLFRRRGADVVICESLSCGLSHITLQLRTTGYLQKPGSLTPFASVMAPSTRTMSNIGSATAPPSTPLCASSLAVDTLRLAYTTPRMPKTTQGSFSSIQVELERRTVSM